MKETLGNLKSTRLSITILGSSSVGKTALTVRYLTGRFIGEYDSGTDMTYRQAVPYLGGSLTTNVDILDISRPAGKMEDDLFQCSDKNNAYLVVYSLTDMGSFNRAQEILSKLPLNAPKYLVANQLDLQHRRQVTRTEGQSVADRFGCPFDEFSAAESIISDGNNVKIAFQKLIRQLISHSHILSCPKIRFSTFSKLFGSFVAKTRQVTHIQHKKLQRSRPHKSSKSSVSSGSRDSSCGSSSSSGSDISIATITSETSFMQINSDDRYETRPIPIVNRKTYSPDQIASI